MLFPLVLVQLWIGKIPQESNGHNTSRKVNIRKEELLLRFKNSIVRDWLLPSSAKQPEASAEAEL